MKLKQLLSIFILASSLSSTLSEAIIYKMTTLTKKFKNGKTIYIHSLHDMHEIYLDRFPKKLETNMNIKYQLLQSAKKLNAYVLVEDMDQYESEKGLKGSLLKLTHFKKTRTLPSGALLATYKYLKKQNVNVYNVEKRQIIGNYQLNKKEIAKNILARIYSIIIPDNILLDFIPEKYKKLGKIIKQTQSIYNILKTTCYLGHLYLIGNEIASVEKKTLNRPKEIKTCLEELKDQDEGELNWLNDIETLLKILEIEEKHNPEMKPLEHNKNIYYSILKEKLNLDKKENKNTKDIHIIFYAGGYHNRRIENMLLEKQFGYKEKYSKEIPSLYKLVKSISFVHLNPKNCIDKGIGVAKGKNLFGSSVAGIKPPKMNIQEAISTANDILYASQLKERDLIEKIA